MMACCRLFGRTLENVLIVILIFSAVGSVAIAELAHLVGACRQGGTPTTLCATLATNREIKAFPVPSVTRLTGLPLLGKWFDVLSVKGNLCLVFLQ